VWPSPVVALNRTIPLAMAAGPDAALAEVERLERDGRLAGYQYLPAIKADLLSRLGRTAAAAAAYRQALDLTANEAERAFLAGRLAAVEAASAHEELTPLVPPEIPEGAVDQGVGDHGDVRQAHPAALAAERLVLGTRSHGTVRDDLDFAFDLNAGRGRERSLSGNRGTCAPGRGSEPAP
jgi:hypothetical protein